MVDYLKIIFQIGGDMEKKSLFVGVDLGGTFTKIAFVDENGEMVSKWEMATDHDHEGNNIPINIVRSIEEQMANMGIEKDEIQGIGIGVPGPVEEGTGVVIQTVNLRWHTYYPLKEKLENLTSLPVFVENDANCAALGEMWKGAGKGTKDMILVTLGTGIGGGVIANGKIVRGVQGAGGEIGHITCVPRGGAPCNCGKTGCLETIASATGIVRLAMEKLNGKEKPQGKLAQIFREKGKITAKDVFDCARSGDEISLNVIKEAAYYLGLALANVANTLNPEMIIIGGGVSKSGDLLLPFIQSTYQQFAFPLVKQSTRLSVALLGNDAGVIGAAFLVKK